MPTAAICQLNSSRGEEAVWVSVSEPFLFLIPQRRKHFSWLNGHWPEHTWRPSGHQGKIVRRGSNEVLRVTEKLNGFSRNVIPEQKYQSQNAKRKRKLGQRNVTFGSGMHLHQWQTSSWKTVDSHKGEPTEVTFKEQRLLFFLVINCIKKRGGTQIAFI